MENDRRQSKRGTLFTEVQYEGAGVRAETRISDISLSGVFIDALTPLPEGVTLSLVFTLPGGLRVATDGVVVQSQPRIGMGVAFTNLKPEDAKLIQEAIEAHQ